MSPSANATSLGSSPNRRPLTRGIYVPTVAFFDPDTEELDTKTTGRHAVRLARAGVAGIAVQGSNGEAVHLLHDERSAVTRATRAALDAAGFAGMPLIVGCGAQSTLEAVRLCQAAAAAGGDYALVLPPSYYRGLFDAAATVVDFFTAVADASPIPLLVYNYPGATPGVDLDSDTLARLAGHPNIVGCKFTCGNTGKLGRVAAAAAAAAAAKDGGGEEEFLCFSGSADFTLPALAAGGAGVICGLGNVAPRACVRVFDVAEREGGARGGGGGGEAVRLQEIVSRGDWVVIKTGVVGVKVALNEYAGYGGWSRRPLPRPDGARAKEIVDGLKELMDLENSLQDKF